MMLEYQIVFDFYLLPVGGPYPIGQHFNKLDDVKYFINTNKNSTRMPTYQFDATRKVQIIDTTVAKTEQDENDIVIFGHQKENQEGITTVKKDTLTFYVMDKLLYPQDVQILLHNHGMTFKAENMDNSKPVLFKGFSERTSIGLYNEKTHQPSVFKFKSPIIKQLSNKDIVIDSVNFHQIYPSPLI